MMRRWTGWGVGVVTVVVSASIAGATPSPMAAQTAQVNTIRAERVNAGPAIDGRLDDAVWSSAPAFSDLRQRNPDEGQPVSERTEVRFLITADALYVGARMWDSEPDLIRARLARRDAQTDADFFSVMIDSRHDHLSAFEFQVNPSGSRVDGVRGASEGALDLSWDPVWSAATSVDGQGWTAEMRIPLSQLRFQPGTDPEWGIQFLRAIARKQEYAWYELVPRTEALVPQRYGHLVLSGSVDAPRRLEIAPYVLASGESANPAPGDPFRSDNELSSAVGVDLSFGITGDLTLNATVNPDFGQVELDPAVVNLSAFESFFPERRPFFVEGADLFAFGQTGGDINQFDSPNLFYSRRIGRAPQRRLGGFEYVDAPETSTIAGAMKITGRVGERWTLGVMEAATTEEHARVAGGGTIGEELVEPFTNTFVGRLRGDFRGGQTTFGVMTTAVNRDVADSPIENLLPSGAYVAGVDWNHTWDRRSWFFNGFLAGSRVQGAEPAIQRLQRSSARYFQRPDADHVEFDPTRTNLSGVSGAVGIGRTGGSNWLGSVVAGFQTPEWEINDAGFFTTADQIGVQGLVTYRDLTPNRITRNFRIDATTQYYQNFDGDVTYREYALGSIVQWANYFQTATRLFVRPRFYTPQITRGGPMAIQPAHWLFAFQGGSDARKSWQVNWNFQYLTQEIGGAFRNWSLGTTLRPSSALTLSVQPTYQTTGAKAQYVGAIQDPLSSNTGDVRYILAGMDQHVFSINTRLNWTFAPNLSLELFAQPFIASADYTQYKQLAAPRTIDLIVFGEDQGTVTEANGRVTIDPDGTGPAGAFSFGSPDFEIRSLRGNAVLRWEYRPGSTLFFVWQQQRRHVGPFAEFDVLDDLGGVFDAKPENVFAVKATWWVGF